MDRLSKEDQAYSAVEGDSRMGGSISKVVLVVTSVALGGFIVYLATGRGGKQVQDLTFNTIPYDAPSERVEPPKPVTDDSRIFIPPSPPVTPPAAKVAEGP